MVTPGRFALPTKFVPVPFSGGQGKPGAAAAPFALLSAEFTSVLQSLGVTYSIEGFQQSDIDEIERRAPRKDEAGVKNFDLVSEVCRELYEQVRIVGKDHTVVTLGGDHSVAVGSIAGMCEARKGLKVVWVDAHADINTRSGSVSGHLHGCPVSFLLGLGDSRMPWLTPPLRASDLVYIGLRDVEAQEVALLQENQIRCYYMSDVRRLGIEEVIRQVADFVGDAPVHVSLDVDGLDPEYMGATGTPVAGGLSYQDVKKLIEALRPKNLVSLDVVEVNPEEGSEYDRVNTVANACGLIAEFLA